LTLSNFGADFLFEWPVSIALADRDQLSLLRAFLSGLPLPHVLPGKNNQSHFFGHTYLPSFVHSMLAQFDFCFSGALLLVS
jgi:hypothetical protein